MRLSILLRPVLTAALLSIPCFAAEEGHKIQLRQGFPFVDVNINGRGPFRMLIDTGANASLLTPRAADRAKLKFDHRVILTTVAGEKVVPGASSNRIDVGEVQEYDLAILSMDMPEVRSIDPGADGVLGQSFLDRNAYLLDYQNKRLWLGQEATTQAMRLPNTVDAFHSDGRTVLQVALEAGGPAWRLALDSGSTNLIIDCRERCPQASGLQRDSRLITHTGERDVLRGTLRHVELGGMKLPNADVVMMKGAIPEGWDDGLIPTRWFSAFYVSGSVVRFAPAR